MNIFASKEMLFVIEKRKKMDKDMADANVSWTPVNVTDLDLKVRRGDKVMDGGCNHCTDRDRYRKITVIELRGMSFRLCDKCKKMLKKLL